MPCEKCKVMDLLDEFNRNLRRNINVREHTQTPKTSSELVQESLESAMITIRNKEDNK